MPCLRQNAVSAGYERSTRPRASSSSCTRTRLPLQLWWSARISSRCGSAFSARTSAGGAAVPSASTSLTAPREIPSARAMAREPWPASRSVRMACRIVWSSIHLLDGGAERRERLARGAPRLGELGGEATAVANPAAGAPRDRGERRQVLVKGGRLVGGFALRRGQRAQEQQRLGDDALLAGAVGAPPRDVQRAELADRDAGVAEPGEQLLALPLVGPGQRHQVLHRGLRRHGPG